LYQAILDNEALHVGAEVGVAILQSGPDGINAVSPKSVDQLIFPCVEIPIQAVLRQNYPNYLSITSL